MKVMVVVLVSMGLSVSESSALLLWVCKSVAVEESGWNETDGKKVSEFGLGEDDEDGVADNSFVTVEEREMLT